MKEMKFNDEAPFLTNLQPGKYDGTYFHGSAIRDAEHVARFPTTYTVSTAYSVEHCARFCLLSSSCDMFEYQPSTCKMFPQEKRKLQNLFEYVIENPSPGVEHAVRVLHCSPAMENIINSVDIQALLK